MFILFRNTLCVATIYISERRLLQSHSLSARLIAYAVLHNNINILSGQCKRKKGENLKFKGEKTLLKNKYKSIISTVIVIFMVIILFVLFKDKLLKILYPKTYSEIITTYAEKYDVEENLIYAVIKAESNFDSSAVSNKSAIGLMQIVEETALDVAKKNNIELDTGNLEEELLDIDNNIHIGTKYLETLLRQYGNKEVALAAYNAGIGTVNNWIEKQIIKADGSDIENIPYKETNNYVRKILRDYNIYNDLYR